MEFDSLDDFINVLEKSVLPKTVAVDKGALTEAADFLTKAAIGKFGSYQRKAGPFPAWKPLADDTKIIRVKQGYSEDEPLLRTGETRDSVSNEVSDSEAVIGSTKQEMIYHELGTKTEPPRPVFGPVAFESKKQVMKIIGSHMFNALINSDNKTKPIPDLSQYNMENK